MHISSFPGRKFATAYDWMNKHISYLIYPLVPRNNWTLQIIAFQWRTHESYWLQLFDNTTLLWCSSAPGSITHFRLTAVRVMSPNFIGLASGSSASYLQLAILMRQFNFRISFGKTTKLHAPNSHFGLEDQNMGGVGGKILARSRFRMRHSSLVLSSLRLNRNAN